MKNSDIAHFAFCAIASLILFANVGCQQKAVDARGLQGTWRAVSVAHFGEHDKGKWEEPIVWVFAGDTVTLNGYAPWGKTGTYKIDPAKVPPQMDLYVTSAYGTRFLPGICRLESDRLEVCFDEGGFKVGDGERPVRFAAAAKKNWWHIVFQREKS